MAAGAKRFADSKPVSDCSSSTGGTALRCGIRTFTHLCMHGGARKKAIYILHHAALDLSSMQRSCDGQHQHATYNLLINAHGNIDVRGLELKQLQIG